MNNKFKKRLTSVFLILCYCLGYSIAPISAASDSTLDSLLEHRDGTVTSDITENQDSSQDTTKAPITDAESKIAGAESVDDFLDVKRDDWFYIYLEDLVSKGIINGKSKTEFAPGGTFSFAECSAVITRYLGLESEAAIRKQELTKLSLDGGDTWYSGYFQLLHELGIFNEDMKLYTLSDGHVVISDKKADTPMKRYEFASAIAKSFELDGTIRSKNIYSEVSGLGHDFIIGGFYDKNYLSSYSNYIKDYNLIPEYAREDVLKVYYNGIFIGDTAGNFNPESNIKRSEMAKVLATIGNFSLRKCLITDYYTPVSEDKLFYDSNNEKSLNYKYALQVLQDYAVGFDASGDVLKYTPQGALPYGYAVDVYLYSVNAGKCDEVLQYSLANSGVYGEGFEYSITDNNNLRAIMVLRNLTDNAKSEFTLNVSISNDGILTKSMIC